MRRSFIWLLTALGLAWLPVFPSVASVDDTLEQIEDAESEPLRTDVPTLAERRFPPIRIRLDEEIEWGKFGGTDVTTFRTRLRAEVILPFTPRLVTALSLSGAIRVTEFNGGGGDFVESGRDGDPWDNLNEFFIRYRGIYQINENWGVLAAAWTSSRFEDGVAVSDGLRGAGASGLTYQFGKGLSITAGVAVSSRMVGSKVSINPFGQLSWQINDIHRLSTSGLGAQLRSKWSSNITTFFYGRLQGRRWRLDDRKDDPVDGVGKGSLRDRKAPIGIGVQWKFLKGWRFRGDFGLLVLREIKVTNGDGNTVDTKKGDAPGVFGSLMLQRRF